MVEPSFPTLSADDINSEPTQLESLCVNCGEDGITKLLLTKIPHYKEIIIMSFVCQHCNFSNNEIQSAGRIQEQGMRYEVKISTERDLSRQVIKSDHATIHVPEIDLEIPPMSQKGEISTVEGVLSRTIAGLEQEQPVRKIMDPDNATKIEDYIETIKELLKLSKRFTIFLDDPSGNSFIENPMAPAADLATKVTYYERTEKQNHNLAIYTTEELQEADGAVLDKKDDDTLNEEKLKEEVLQFATNCPECNAPCETNMKMTQIPFFKDVVIMATICDVCGNKTNEVKSGGGIEEKGKKNHSASNRPI